MKFSHKICSIILFLGCMQPALAAKSWSERFAHYHSKACDGYKWAYDNKFAVRSLTGFAAGFSAMSFVLGGMELFSSYGNNGGRKFLVGVLGIALCSWAEQAKPARWGLSSLSFTGCSLFGGLVALGQMPGFKEGIVKARMRR